MEFDSSRDYANSYVHPPLTKSPFAKLAAKDGAECKSFCKQMRMCGIAVVSLDEMDPRLQVFDECTKGSVLVKFVVMPLIVGKAAASFFENHSREEKQKDKMMQEHDWGYVEMEGIKEFWQMRNGAANPWAVQSKRFFDTCTEIAETCLASLAQAIGTQECELVEKVVDKRDAELSSTIFRFFHYYKSQQVACQVHTDVGLITIIPATNLPSLEVLDNLSYQWYNYEEQLGRGDLMVLCGETLELLTACYFRAVVHRVRPNIKDRYSLVYLMRARADAVLDCRALKSRVIGELPETMFPATTVAKFMREQYLNKQSANFVDPGQGLPMLNMKGEDPTEEELQKWKTLAGDKEGDKDKDDEEEIT